MAQLILLSSLDSLFRLEQLENLTGNHHLILKFDNLLAKYNSHILVAQLYIIVHSLDWEIRNWTASAEIVIHMYLFI